MNLLWGSSAVSYGPASPQCSSPGRTPLPWKATQASAGGVQYVAVRTERSDHEPESDHIDLREENDADCGCQRGKQ